MRRVVVPVLLLLLPALAFAEDSGIFESKEEGFRIERPDDSWSIGEVPAISGTRFAAKVARGGEGDETSVIVYVTDENGITDPYVARDAAMTAKEGQPGHSGVYRGVGEIAGEEVHAVTFTLDNNGKPYTVRQHFLVHHDAIFIIQFSGPEETFKESMQEFARIAASFQFLESADLSARGWRSLLKRMTANCGSEIPWASSWKEAADRALKEDKLVVVVFEEYRGLNIEHCAPLTLFMDTDVVELMNERFVGLIWMPGMNAPFEKPKVYGVGPGTFGQGTLFVKPDGRVVSCGVSFDPFYFYDHAREVLRRHPGTPTEESIDAEGWLRRGELDRAAELLASPSTADEYLLKADLLRRLRKGDEALQAIAKARKFRIRGVDPKEAVVRLRMGQFAEAGKLLAGRGDAESCYWRALAHGMQLGIEPIRKELQDLAVAHSDDRWAWRGVAMLSGKSAASAFDHAKWPDERRIAACLQPGRKAPSDMAQAERDGARFLLLTQLPDGSWPSPMSLIDPQGAIAVGITAICGESLLAHRDAAGADDAILEALDFTLAATLTPDEARLFDHTIWAQCFALRFFAASVQAKVGNREKLLARMNDLVSGIRKSRRAGGGWSYLKLESREDASIGFVTAAVLCALHEAKSAGTEVPKFFVDKAADTLAALRTPQGAFAYRRQMAGSADEREAEASLRSPLVAFALKRARKGDVEGIRAALEIYLKHHKHVRRERGKGLSHTGPEGTASYYLIFGYAFAAEAVRELPEKERAKYREALAEDLLKTVLEDGAFCDSPSVGRHYGTGMALRALRLLKD
ncbi:MAG: hypothetical protein AAB074_21280 [Planctomycetota bacterium]